MDRAGMAGDSRLGKVLFLHADLEIGPGRRQRFGLPWFVVEVFETAEEASRLDNPVFRCQGTGYPEWQNALSCLNQWGRPLDWPSYKAALETWLCACTARAARESRLICHLRCKLHDQGKGWTNLFKSRLRACRPLAGMWLVESAPETDGVGVFLSTLALKGRDGTESVQRNQMDFLCTTP